MAIYGAGSSTASRELSRNLRRWDRFCADSNIGTANRNRCYKSRLERSTLLRLLNIRRCPEFLLVLISKIETFACVCDEVD